MQKMMTLNQLVELAMATEQNNELPWDKLTISKETAYGMMAAHIIDMFNEYESDADKQVVMMSVMVKLLVENFILQLVVKDKNS